MNKKVQIVNGLFRGSEGVVVGNFSYNGKDLYTVKIRKQKEDGEAFNAWSTVTLDEVKFV